MAIKHVDVPGIGAVKLTKRKGTKHLRLKLAASGEVIVSMPTWLPYTAGRAFALKNRDWIEKNIRPRRFLQLNMTIGKTHILDFIQSDREKIRTVVANARITVHIPKGHTIRSEDVQAAAVKGVKKALQAEGGLLTDRLTHLSSAIGLPYTDVSLKFMKSKWGSCRHDHRITLNYRLLDLPNELIDYVIIHELAHTKYLNHSSEFWRLVERHMPDFKTRRRQLKSVQLAW